MDAGEAQNGGREGELTGSQRAGTLLFTLLLFIRLTAEALLLSLLFLAHQTDISSRFVCC